MLKSFVATLFAVLLVGSMASAFTEADALKEAVKYDLGCNDWAPATAERISISFKYSFEGADDPVREQGYFIVTCESGTYNQVSILLREQYFSNVLEPVSFAVPMVNPQRKIVGYAASIMTGSLTYDPKTQQLSTFSKSRGLGDLYVSGKYQLFESHVILREYTIDNIEGSEVEVPPVFKETEPIEL